MSILGELHWLYVQEGFVANCWRNILGELHWLYVQKDFIFSEEKNVPGVQKELGLLHPDSNSFFFFLEDQLTFLCLLSGIGIRFSTIYQFMILLGMLI